MKSDSALLKNRIALAISQVLAKRPGAELVLVLIAANAVGQSGFRVQQIDPREDSIHIRPKNRMSLPFRTSLDAAEDLG
jgi:hypothetical protein